MFIMGSRATLLFHSIFFFGLTISCFASPFIALTYPQAFNAYSLWVFVGIGILILGSWYKYGGDCPLTVWENDFRKKEGRPVYTGSCIVLYGKKWFGLSLTRQFSSIFPIAILLIPILTRFFI